MFAGIPENCTLQTHQTATSIVMVEDKVSYSPRQLKECKVRVGSSVTVAECICYLKNAFGSCLPY